jgi:hypothetical protein
VARAGTVDQNVGHDRPRHVGALGPEGDGDLFALWRHLDDASRCHRQAVGGDQGVDPGGDPRRDAVAMDVPPWPKMTQPARAGIHFG